MRRALIGTLEKIDEALDQVLYRPAVVRAFRWVPRWWLCDLAKLSIWLDERWSTGWWEEERIEPGGPCQACGRRAAIHVLGGPGPDGEHFDDFLETHPVYLCGWCPIPGPIKSQDDLERALVAARSASVSWRWRWPVTDALPPASPFVPRGPRT